MDTNYLVEETQPMSVDTFIDFMGKFRYNDLETGRKGGYA